MTLIGLLKLMLMLKPMCSMMLIGYDTDADSDADALNDADWLADTDADSDADAPQ